MQPIIRFIKDWTLVIAMLAGSLFYPFFNQLSVTTPYLIFLMLLLTFTKLSPRKIRLHPLHAWLAAIQLFGSIALYLLLLPIHPIVAQSALIVVLAPTATAAAVVTRMLGGSVASITTYTLVVNLMVALTAPILFSLTGSNPDMDFWTSFWYICQKVVPLLTLPLILAWSMQRYTPTVHRFISGFQSLSFYLWAIALTVVTARTVHYLFNQTDPDWFLNSSIALIALLLCAGQFLLGRALGKRYKKTIAGGQSLGQKNTILAIWMAQTFLHPVASLGPASYVLWQNIVNSWQLYKRRKTHHS